MKFSEIGDRNNPVIIMLAGSFCPASCLEYLYKELKEDYYIIAPTYNGHYEGGGEFTTRSNEALEIKNYCVRNNISGIKMIYGQSMGSEIGIELMKQLSLQGIIVEKAVFDGAPCITLSKAYKTFMFFKFRTMIKLVQKKGVDGVVNMKFLNQFTNGDTEALRKMIEELASVAPYLSKQSIKNETECCYTFDFPTMSKEQQQNMYFFYAAEEKAYKTCYRYVKNAYPSANFRVEKGYGHITFSVKNKDEYIRWLRKICSE